MVTDKVALKMANYVLSHKERFTLDEMVENFAGEATKEKIKEYLNGLNESEIIIDHSSFYTLNPRYKKKG